MDASPSSSVSGVGVTAKEGVGSGVPDGFTPGEEIGSRAQAASIKTAQSALSARNPARFTGGTSFTCC